MIGKLLHQAEEGLNNPEKKDLYAASALNLKVNHDIMKINMYKLNKTFLIAKRVDKRPIQMYRLNSN